MRHIILISCSILITSCASITGFEEGRSNGKNNFTFIPSINYSVTPELTSDENYFDLIGAPFVELSGRYGITEKFDLGIKANTFLNLGLTTKLQLVGDRTSKFALGTGLDFGVFGGLNIWNVQFPIYTSFYPTDKVCLYLTPKYIYQTAGIQGGGANYLGSNFGVLFGSTHKIGIDIAYFRIGNDDTNAGFFNFGIGGKFQFGNNLFD